MKTALFYFFIVSLCSKITYGLEGTTDLEKKLFDTSQELGALQNQIEEKKSEIYSSYSKYYPTLNVVTGWAQNKTDDFSTTASGYQKGYLGYIDGQLNLFNGFKSKFISDQKQIDFEIASLHFEQKKRALKSELTEIISNMILIHKYQDILAEEYKVTQSQKQMAFKKVAAGLTGQVDNLEMDLRESEIKIELAQIRQQHVEAHENLRKIFGSNIEDSELSQAEFSPFKNENLGIKSNQLLTVENTIQLKLVTLLKNKSILEKKEAQSDFLPTLDFMYSLGRLSPQEDQPLKLNEYKYGITLTIPLFSGFETFYKTKAANFKINQSEKEQLQIQYDVTAEYNILKQKKYELADLFQINEIKLQQLQKYFNLTVSEYKKGLKNSPDVVSATERFFSAKKKRYEILKQIELTQVKIENLF